MLYSISYRISFWDAITANSTVLSLYYLEACGWLEFIIEWFLTDTNVWANAHRSDIDSSLTQHLCQEHHQMQCSCVSGNPSAALFILMIFGILSKRRIFAHFILDQMSLTPAVWQHLEPNTNIPVGGGVLVWLQGATIHPACTCRWRVIEGTFDMETTPSHSYWFWLSLQESHYHY